MRCDLPAEVQHQTPRMRHELGGSVHDFLQDGTNAAAFGRMSDRREVAGQAKLSHQEQAVVGKDGQLQDGIIGIKFPGNRMRSGLYSWQLIWLN